MKKKRVCDIPGYENCLPWYYVSDEGHVTNDYGNVKERETEFGYLYVQLNTNEKKINTSGYESYISKKVFISNLVANAFRSGFRKPGMVVHHRRWKSTK